MVYIIRSRNPCMQVLQAHCTSLDFTSYWEWKTESLQLRNTGLSKVTPVTDVCKVNQTSHNHVTGEEVAQVEEVVHRQMSPGVIQLSQVDRAPVLMG